MSDLTSASYEKGYCDNKGTGNNSMLMIFLLLFLCTGDGGFLGGGDKSCGCGSGGLDGILPLILIMCLCGGSF